MQVQVKGDKLSLRVYALNERRLDKFKIVFFECFGYFQSESVSVEVSQVPNN